MMGAPRWSRAQEQNPTTVPTELALALLDRGEYESERRTTRLIVGRAPEGVPRNLTTFEGGTVLGGVEYPQNSVVVIAFSLPPNQVLLSADRQLRARGLTPPPPPPGADRGGFVSSTFPSAWGNVYCTDSATVMVSSAPAPAGGTYLKISRGRTQQFSACSPRRERSAFGETGFKFPALLPPPGMTAHRNGSGIGGRNASISAGFNGPLKPADMVAHYRKQLDAAGWRTRTPATSSEEAALAYVEATDSTGVVWRGC